MEGIRSSNKTGQGHGTVLVSKLGSPSRGPRFGIKKPDSNLATSLVFVKFELNEENKKSTSKNVNKFVTFFVSNVQQFSNPMPIVSSQVIANKVFFLWYFS